MRAHLARLLRVWLACLAVFAAAATPLSASQSPERPTITAVVGTEERAVNRKRIVAPRAVDALETVTCPPCRQRVHSARLFVRHHALLC
jgi:hypothetical protein